MGASRQVRSTVATMPSGKSPCRPTTAIQDAELHDDILALTALRTDSSLGSGIDAQRTVTLSTAITFVILPQLPSRLRDGVLFSRAGHGRPSRRHLHKQQIKLNSLLPAGTSAGSVQSRNPLGARIGRKYAHQPALASAADVLERGGIIVPLQDAHACA